MLVCVLASGSSGNSTYVATGTTRLLIDAGLSGAELARRLERIGVRPSTINAICVTHEHEDHVAGLGVLHRRYGVPVYANSATIEAVEKGGKAKGIRWNVFTTGHAFCIGDLELHPFSVPHDSYDPVGFVVRCEPATLGVVTDMGVPTELIRDRLRQCHAVVLESNHDDELLRNAQRPWPLKQRIASRQGHLSNVQAARLLKSIVGGPLRVIFLAHLSSDCNRPTLALRTAHEVLRATGCPSIEIKLTYQDTVSEMVVIG